jgi:mannose-6-phosphate isomerase-like protein (cupin superfamily)
MQDTTENNDIPVSQVSAKGSSPTGGSRMAAVSKDRPLNHYQWGNHCDGWNLVDEAGLSVKQELMHYHAKSQQFFFILKGSARLEVEDWTIEIKEGEGLHIKAGTRHRITNDSSEDLEFLLCSQPSTKDDRVNCE